MIDLIDSKLVLGPYGRVQKQHILWYNTLSVGIGPAKATVWKSFHAALFYKEMQALSSITCGN